MISLCRYFILLKLFLCSTLIFLCFSSQLRASDNSALVSADFEWVLAEDLRARFLIPSDWEVRHSQGKIMSSLVFIENSDKSNIQFPAEMSVNVVPNLTQMSYRLVSRQVSQYAKDLTAFDSYTVLSRSPISRGEYRGESVTLSLATKGNKKMVEQRLYLANDKRDWLMIIKFSCEEGRWEQLDATRRKVLNGFVLN